MRIIYDNFQQKLTFPHIQHVLITPVENYLILQQGLSEGGSDLPN